jgi:hypothetical protein
MKHRIPFAIATVLFCAWNAFAQDAKDKNLIANAGFEQSVAEEGSVPAEWVPFTSKNVVIGTASAVKRNGAQSLKISAQKAPNAFQGVNYTMPVTAGSRYTFSAYVMNDKSDPLKNTANGMLVIEWKSADNKEMSRILSKLWDPGLSKMRWEQFSINNAEPPKGAVSATFGIHFCEGKEGADGSVFVDDVMLIEK